MQEQRPAVLYQNLIYSIFCYKNNYTEKIISQLQGDTHTYIHTHTHTHIYIKHYLLILLMRMSPAEDQIYMLLFSILLHHHGYRIHEDKGR
jgi:hypothetical protein